MSDEETFLARWARRKHEEQAASDAAQSNDDVKHAERADTERVDITRIDTPDTPTTVADGSTSDGSATRDAPAAEPRAPVFDVASLPPLESITAASDIRAYLAPGVPTELTRAALRRAWSTDPAIRDFIGLAENSWDFTAPGAIAGFGPLELTEEVKRQVADLVGRSIGAPLDQEAARPPSNNETPAAESPLDIKAESAPVADDTPVPRDDTVPQATAEPVAFHDPDAALAEPDVDTASQHSPETSDTDLLPRKRPHGRALPK